MNDEQFKQFLEHQDKTLKEGIETHVNGKIRSLTTKFEVYVEDDMQWKKDVTPYIVTVQDVKSFSRVGTSVLKLILLIGSVTTAIYAAIKLIRSLKL